MKKWVALLLAVCALGACKNYQILPLTLPDGFVVDAWVADTPAKQEKGLMFVKELSPNKGMLFVFDQEQDHVFWMKNTLIDLDIVFIGADKAVTRVASQVPHSYTYTPDDEVAYVEGYGRYVLELPAKTAQAHRIAVGNQLAFNYEE